ncbi:MAG: SRPBCC family protein [Dehalococcoidia bacterium]
MTQYSFRTTWRFQAPIEQVWAAIRNYEAWPSWWDAVVEARQLAPSDADGRGEVVRFGFRTRLFYHIRFILTVTDAQPPSELTGQATGQLSGTGRWRLREDAGGTVVRYAWDVSTTRRWMNLLGPIARPAFNWNHDWVMERGYVGLSRLIADQAEQTPGRSKQP